MGADDLAGAVVIIAMMMLTMDMMMSMTVPIIMVATAIGTIAMVTSASTGVAAASEELVGTDANKGWTD